MATVAADLMERVRSQINEAARVEDPQREDAEILEWLNEACIDLVAKLPTDAFPELIKQKSATGTSIPIPDDFIKVLQVRVSHNIPSGTANEVASILEIDEQYLQDNFPPGMGAYAIFRPGRIDIGPGATSGVLTYQKCPQRITDICSEFPLGCSFEGPVVNYASAHALAKIQDAGSEFYLGLYNSRVQAEQVRYGKPELERVD